MNILLKKLKNKEGGIVLSTGSIFFTFMIICFFFLLGMIIVRIVHIRETSQNALDVYTSIIGKQIIASIKSGNDYTSLIDEQIFKEQLQKQLLTKSRFTGHDTEGRAIYSLTNLKLSFVYEQTLKTKLSYTLSYQAYYLDKPLQIGRFNFAFESSYYLKY